METVEHPFKPVYNKDSRIMFLGSIASEKTRQIGYPYASPNNRFWKVLEIIFNDKMIDYKEYLLNKKIALWDVIKSCEINKSSDASIKNVVINEIWEVVANSNIKQIFTNGKKADELYNKYVYPRTNMKSICLPSTSSANAVKRLDDLVKEYKIILKHLD